ncbi:MULTISPECIES: 2,4'-dihydroxyacetophenone dioxygenase family protein [Pseudomonas]|uniref:2,4'-dihydroxyacetophenone dioxygenase family protein n=1 Tax=Pseudomonas TaxID=286 RepID=UPI0015B7E0C1|nr:MULTISPECIES: 2,4'-dihydroxyacetophenone dioxygenase family protein [Pseudomonas]MDH4846219.1 hypothetical protein [Pseudomonas sp. BN605]MDH4858508.1 hypothetical protein [Pseudomonas sp. BN505]NWL08012.1 hypothetical protein [Pseudomonas hunanensis]
MTASMNAPLPMSLHVDTDAFPFARDYYAEGLNLKLLQADVEGGVFAVRISFAPGVQLPPHKHTGAVHAYTLKGEWTYLEHVGSPSSTAGSYLYEPPGSVHTLKVADHNTEETDVVFIIYGAMLLLDDHGNITGVLDAQSQHDDWTKALRSQNDHIPAFITGGQIGYFQEH